MTFCSMTLACVYSRISWTSKAKNLKTAALTIQMAWKMFDFIVCIFLCCSCESNFRWGETDFRSRQREAPVPILQHERRRLRSCSDAVFSVNELKKKIPLRKWASNQWRCWWWWHSWHAEFKAIVPESATFYMLSSEAYVGGKNRPPPRIL